MIELLIALFIVTAASAWVRWRRSARVLLAMAAALTLIVGYGLIAWPMLESLQSAYPDEAPGVWRARAAIIVLGGGAQRLPGTRELRVPPLFYGRIVKGMELYRECKRAGSSCVLLVSGGDTSSTGTSEAKVYAAVLERLGVDPADVVIEGHSLNTWQNAQYCASWLHAHPQEEVLLVSSGLHVRRSVLYFSHFGVHALGVRADYERAALALVPQGSNFLLTDLALHEYTGMLRYRLYERMGWNIQVRGPGAP